MEMHDHDYDMDLQTKVNTDVGDRQFTTLLYTVNMTGPRVTALMAPFYLVDGIFRVTLGH